jgi:hypothetical protein
MIDARNPRWSRAAGTLVTIVVLTLPSVVLATQQAQERQAGREANQGAKQEARQGKVDCKAADQQSNAECRQDKRDTKQEGRQEKREIKR